jgi:uncharacterized protein (TIGR02231 family)
VKQVVALALVLSLPLAGKVQAADVDAASRIDSVTVFPMGAEVTRVAKVQLDKGEHAILFRDLPASAVEGSIRVEGNATGKLEIGSVDTRKLFVPRADAEASATERRRIEDEIEKLRDERANFEAQVQGAETQRSLILNLTQLPTRPSPAAGADVKEDWTAILALIASGSAEAQRALQDGQIKIRETDRKIEDLEKALAEIAPDKTERTEAKVFVVAQSALEADITVRYQVSHASWTPLYDVRLQTGAKTVAPSIELTRRAAINQKTGETWDNVALTLSTTRPTAGAAAPELAPLIVDFEPPPRPVPSASIAPATGRGMAEAAAAPPAPEPADEEKDYKQRGGLGAVAQPEKVEVAERPAEMVQAPFHALFAVPGRLTIPETGESKRVQLGNETIEPELTIRTVPKVDAKAYLYAKFNLPKGSPLLPGAVSLFRDGTFVGSGRLPLLSPGEEHELGFGVDDLVRVRHAISEEKRGETGLISTSRTDSRNYLMSVKSMHERAIALAVFDQIPVSANQEIKVELTGKNAPTKQNVDDKRGVLVWEGTLEPDQEQTIEFGYRVSWPSSKAIVYRQ